jgi:hypothetical protein
MHFLASPFFGSFHKFYILQFFVLRWYILLSNLSIVANSVMFSLFKIQTLEGNISQLPPFSDLFKLKVCQRKQKFKFDNKMYIVCNVYCPSILFQHLQNILFCSITINKYIVLRSCNIIVHFFCWQFLNVSLWFVLSINLIYCSSFIHSRSLKQYKTFIYMSLKK